MDLGKLQARTEQSISAKDGWRKLFRKARTVSQMDDAWLMSPPLSGVHVRSLVAPSTPKYVVFEKQAAGKLEVLKSQHLGRVNSESTIFEEDLFVNTY